MNIKQIEEITGMTRANIRFYETEGLISPQRKENGYRVYSEEDVERLLKIKLLRSLDISIEELKVLQTGGSSLEEVLLRQLPTQQDRLLHWERVQETTRLMLSEGAVYDTMDTRRYLQSLESDWVLQQDAHETLNLPWRRYWARDFDYLLCSLAVSWLMPEPVTGTILLAANLIMLLLLEPLCLHLFATTPGKAIFGIRVTDLEGGRLSYSAALQRTCSVMWEGECMRLPVVSMYFNYRSLRSAENEEMLPWEENSELTFRDDGLWRYWLYILMTVLVFAADAVILLMKEEVIG